MNSKDNNKKNSPYEKKDISDELLAISNCLIRIAKMLKLGNSKFCDVVDIISEEYIKSDCDKNIENFKSEMNLNNYQNNNNINNIQNNKNEGEDIKLKQGSLTKRKDGRWMGRFRSICVYSRDRRVCIQKLQEAIKDSEKNGGRDVVGVNMSLDTWLKYWLKNYAKPNLKQSTYILRENQYKLCLRKSYLANLKMASIKPEHVNTFFKNLENGHQRKECLIILKQAFDKAQAHGYIKTNVIEILSLKFNDYETKKKIKDALTREQEKDLFEFLETRNRDLYLICKFFLYTGARKGEVLALTWEDIDFEKKQISINKSYNSVSHDVTRPKTKASIRVIPMFKETQKILEEIKYMTPRSKPTDIIFNKINNDTLCNSFRYYCSYLGIKSNIHCLRHTFATKCFELGIEGKIVQMWLGHTSYATTINTYTHVSKSLEASQIDIMNDRG